MDSLPDELTFMLFDLLTTSDLIRNCIQVCKRWRNLLVHRYKLKELIVLGDRIWQNNHSWYHTCKPIDIEKIIYCWEINNFKDSSNHNLFFNSPSFVRCFSALRRLKTYLNEYGFDLEQFNQLASLEVLEIENHIHFHIANVKLTLLNLKILKIIIHKGKLIVDSNRLEILSLNGLKTIELVKPKTVKHLELRFYDNTNLSEFTNLEVYKNRFINHFDKNILSRAPNSLKAMHLYSNLWTYNFNSNKNIIDLIMKQKAELKSDVQIYFQGVLLERKQISNYDEDFNFQSDLYILHKNQEHLEETLSWIYSIDYNELTELFDNDLNVTFLKKLTNIQCVFSIGSLDVDQFDRFLDYCPNLYQLRLQDALLGQRFYDDLSGKCPNLMIFEIKEEINGSERRLNYNFILDFKLLEKLVTHDALDMKLIVKILKNLKLIKELKFENHRNLVGIKRLDDNDEFEMKYGCFKSNKNLKIGQLINKCELIDRKSVIRSNDDRSSYEVRKKMKLYKVNLV